MKSRKVIAAILATVLATATLSACGGGGASSAPAANSPASSAPVASSSTPAAAPQQPAKIVVFQNTGKVQGENQAGSNKEYYDEVHQTILDGCNIDVSVIIPAKGEEKTKLNLMMAAREPMDLFNGSWTDYASDKAVTPINDLLEKLGPAVKTAWTADEWAQVTDKDGTIWGVPRMAPTAPYPVYVRGDWLKKLGLEAPKTIDELEAVLKAFKEQDPAGNGQTIPMIAIKDMTLNQVFAAGFTGRGTGKNYYFLDTADGNRAKPYILDPKHKDFLMKMNDWYQKGYIYKEFLSLENNVARDMIKKGNVGVNAMWYSATTLTQAYTKEVVPELEYVLCSSIQGPAGSCQSIGSASPSSMLIPAYSKNPEAAMTFMNWCYSDVRNHLTATEGIEGKNWKFTDEANHVIERLTEGYIGEFAVSMGLGTERQYSMSDPTMKMHYDYIHNNITNLSVGQKGDLHNVVIDNGALAKAVPNLEDINRMIDEEVAKFITGAKSFDEYDAFIKKLYDIGIDKQIDEVTRQYQEANK